MSKQDSGKLKNKDNAQMSIKKLRKAIRKAQDAKRYEHTVGVEYTAAALAMRYGVDVEEALLAGLLHDCAKCLSEDKLIAVCEKNKIPITETEKKLPFLLHGKVGGFLAEKKYGVKNQDVLNAIVHHTMGRAEMSLLEKIVFVADYIEPGRNRPADLDLNSIRELAFQDIDLAMVRVLEGTLDHLRSKGWAIDPQTEKTWKYYKDLFAER